jgi:DNA-binding CsgD family transcriptional regulator
MSNSAQKFQSMPVYKEEDIASIDPIVNGLSQTVLALYNLGVRKRETYSDILLQTLLANPRVLSTWTVWEPDAFDGRDESYRNAQGHDTTGRFIHCWHRASGSPKLIPVTGYENPSAGNWYWLPKRRLTPCRLDPINYRFGPLNVCIRSEITPLIYAGRFCGTVGIDLQAEQHQVQRTLRSPSGRRNSTPIKSLCHSKIDILSPREHEVFHWLEMGKTNEEIGIVLGISHHTVKNHLERIFQKLGVHNRCEAILSMK